MKQPVVQKKNFIFLVAYGIYICSLLLEITPLRESFDKGLQLMRYASYGLFAFKIVIETRNEKKKCVFFAGLLLFLLVQSFIGGGRELVFMLFILFALHNVEIEEVFTTQIIVQTGCIALTFLLCVIGVFPNLEFYDHGQIRYAMGFVYATLPGEVFLGLVFLLLFIRRNKLKIWEVAAIILTFAGIYYFTDSRTTIILGIVLSIFIYLQKFYTRPFKKGFGTFFFYQLMPVYMTLFSWILQFVYNAHPGNRWMSLANRGLNGRLNWAKQSLGEYGIHVLGSNIAWVDNTVNLTRERYNFVDNAYIKLVLDYGWIVGILFLAAYLVIMNRMIQEENRQGCILVCAVLVYAFMTPVLTSFILNPLILLAGGIFHGKTKIRQT